MKHALLHARSEPTPTSGPIIQFWDRDIPERVAELVDSVREVNPAVEHRLFDDVTARAFIHDEFGTDVASSYDACAIPAMRADLFRYCFLARCGGFYIDADFVAVGSIEPLLDERRSGCLYLREKGLTNSMMRFRDPNDPLAERILEEALDRIARRDSSSVWEVTGPGVLRTLYADPSLAPLFEGFHLVDEEEFATYFNPVSHLDYKRNDSHWLVARDKGISIFRD